MAHPLKYAVIERERRFLVRELPGGVRETREVTDRYLTGSRLRLREVRAEDGSVVRKLGHKVRLGVGPGEIAHTSLYLDDDEWRILSGLPAVVLRKRRHLVHLGGRVVAIDEFEDGTLLAEIDDGGAPTGEVPPGLAVIREVSDEEEWTGAGRARALRREQGQGPLRSS